MVISILTLVDRKWKESLKSLLILRFWIYACNIMTLGIRTPFSGQWRLGGANANECTVTRIAEVDSGTPKRNVRRGTDGRAKRRPQATWPSPLYRRPRRWRHFGAHLDLRLVSRNLAPTHVLHCTPLRADDSVSTLRLTSAPMYLLFGFTQLAATCNTSPPRATGTRPNEM